MENTELKTEENKTITQTSDVSLDAIIQESKATIEASELESKPKKKGRPRKDAATAQNPQPVSVEQAFKPAGLAPVFAIAADLPISAIRSKFNLTLSELPSLDKESKKIIAEQLDLVAGMWLPQDGSATKITATVGALAVVAMVYSQVYMSARDIALAKIESERKNE